MNVRMYATAESLKAIRREVMYQSGRADGYAEKDRERETAENRQRER